MSPHRASHVVATLLISLLPVCVHAADPAPDPGAAAASVDEIDLEAVGERIRQTGAQMQADLKKARARIEAQKAQQEAERKREAELARQRAIKEEAEHAAARERAQREAAQRQAEQARQAALAAQRVKEEKAAKARAARALQEARQSEGETFAGEDL